MKNDSRIPIEYEWCVPDKYKNCVIMTPPKSMLLPNEEAKVVATFTPLKKKKYSVTVPIFARNYFEQSKNYVGFYNPGSGLSLQASNMPGQFTGCVTTMRREIYIVGAGSDGCLQISPSILDFGAVTVGFTKTLQLNITNKSNCAMYIKLSMVASGGSITQDAQQLAKTLEECFRFDSAKGLVNAKSKKKINLTFKPNQRYDFSTQL